MGSDYSINARSIIANVAIIGQSLKFRTILHRDLECQTSLEVQISPFMGSDTATEHKIGRQVIQAKLTTWLNNRI